MGILSRHRLGTDIIELGMIADIMVQHTETRGSGTLAELYPKINCSGYSTLILRKVSSKQNKKILSD